MAHALGEPPVPPPHSSSSRREGTSTGLSLQMPVSVDDPYDDLEEDDDEDNPARLAGEELKEDYDDDSVVMTMLRRAEMETTEDAMGGGGGEGENESDGVDSNDGSSSSGGTESNSSSWDCSEGGDDHDDDNDDKIYGDDEEQGYGLSGSQSSSSSSSISTDASSSSSSSSFTASAAASSADASDGSLKWHRGASRRCCPRKRCLWQTAVLVVVVAVPLGMVYRFYRSRHPPNSAEPSKRQAGTYPPLMSSSPSPAPTLRAPTTLDDVNSTNSSSNGNGNDDRNNNNNATTEKLCNGHANLCSTPANQVLFATLHNGHAAYDSGFMVFPNHMRSLEDAVDAGYRGVNVDIGRCDGEVKLTHTYCFLGSRDPIQVFTNLDAWLDDHPNEVLLMPVQIDNDAGGPVSLDEVWNVLVESGNFVDKLYVHNASFGSSYPTLEQLIEMNQRVLFFVYNGEQSCADLNIAQQQQQPQGASDSTTKTTTNSSALSTAVGFTCPDGMYDWFGTDGAAAETEYDFATLQEIEDPSISCRITRGKVQHAPFLGVNVFLNIPDEETSSYLNRADFLGPRLTKCAQLNNRTGVSAVMVDFWDQGDVLEVVRQYNSRL